MSEGKINVLKVATSYPRSETDWQGIFIRHIAGALADSSSLSVKLWSPHGPLPEKVVTACQQEDFDFLKRMTDRGGIAHMIRRNPPQAGYYGLGLLNRLRRLYNRSHSQTDIFHINWLQNALSLSGMGAKAVITVLGTDYQLIKKSVIAQLLRHTLKTNQCILAPNAEWMVPLLASRFGDLCKIQPVNFGVDSRWFDVQKISQETANDQKEIWLCIQRITHEKIGPIFDWGETVFGSDRELHLFGPKQDDIHIPEWVHYHGPIDSDSLAEHWLPSAAGYITLSQHAEGKPQILLEAMASGLVPVVSDIPAHSELITNSENGFLIREKQDLVNALNTLNSDAQKTEMSSKCVATMETDYGTWADCANRYQALYRELMQQ